MEKEIEAFDTTYWDFFNKASHTHLIPALQRPYVWDKTQVLQLWRDLIENNGSNYYIGSIVVIGGGRTVARDKVIDGQQRLTTLSLFLIAIRDYIEKKKNLEDVRSEILSMLFMPKYEGPAIPRLAFSSENSNNLYESLIRDTPLISKKTKVQDNFLANIKTIKQELHERFPKCKPSEIRALLEKIKNLQIVFINCANFAAAYSLFESLNARAVSLVSTDLIKNRIFEAMNREGPKRLEEAEKKWMEIEQNFNEDSSLLKTYIRHQWISRGNYTSHRKLFKDFEEYLDEENSAEAYLNELLKDSRVYVALRNANLEDLNKLPTMPRFDREEIRQSLDFLRFLEVDQLYSVLLYLYKHDVKHFRKDLNKLVAFQALFKFVPGSPSEPEKKYFAALPAHTITKEQMFKGLSSLCINHEHSYVENLLKRWKYREGKSGEVQFALEKYLFNLNGPKAFKKPTVEHIFSQGSNESEMRKLGGTKKEILDALHSIGNLTILEKGENSEDYQNKHFDEKKELYKKDLFAGNKKICKYPFDIDPKKAIEKRGGDIAAELYKIFLNALETGRWQIKTANKIKSK